MSDPFLFTITGAAALAGAVSSVAATVVSVIASRRVRAQKLRDAEANRLEKILATNELEELGAFLDNTIGQFNVAEYTSDEAVAQTIDRYLDGVVGFLGTDEQVAAEESTSGEAPGVGIPLVSHKVRSDPLSKVITELDDGEVWNALARLRREIEIFLRNRATKYGFKERHLRSAGQMVRLLAERGHLPDDVAKQLSYSIAVCNRAIHGRDVTINEAQEAFLIAERVLDEFAA